MNDSRVSFCGLEQAKDHELQVIELASCGSTTPSSTYLVPSPPSPPLPSPGDVLTDVCVCCSVLHDSVQSEVLEAMAALPAVGCAESATPGAAHLLPGPGEVRGHQAADGVAGVPAALTVLRQFYQVRGII